MRCHLGDFAEYAGCAAPIADREKRPVARGRAAPAPDAVASLERLRRGDVIEVPPGGARATPSCSTPARRRARRAAADRADRRPPGAQAHRSPTSPGGVRTVDPVRVPKGFNARNAPRAARPRRPRCATRAAATARDRPAHGRPDRAPRAARRRRRRTTPSSRRCAAALRAHPCHGCADREDHARWAERWDRLSREHDALVAPDRGPDQHDRAHVRPGLRRAERPGYLRRRAVAEARSTGAATRLTRVAGTSVTGRPVAAPPLRRERPAGRGVPAPRHLGRPGPGRARGRASRPSCSRRAAKTGTPAARPGGPTGRLARASTRPSGSGPAGGPRVGAPARADRAARPRPGRGRCTGGRAGGASTRCCEGGDLAAGDFVRWCKQVVDLLDQLGQAAPARGCATPPPRRSTRCAAACVAYSWV